MQESTSGQSLRRNANNCVGETDAPGVFRHFVATHTQGELAVSFATQKEIPFVELWNCSDKLESNFT